MFLELQCPLLETALQAWPCITAMTENVWKSIISAQTLQSNICLLKNKYDTVGLYSAFDLL